MRGLASSLAAVVGAILTVLWVSGSAADDPVPAFPGAVGFGAGSRGGRGGDVYHVTTLANGGTGSLRKALRQKRDVPRTVVFEVGGVIDLESPLTIHKFSGLTIAGQTAPGGITLRGYSFGLGKSGDVVIRYLRVRPGDRRARGRQKSETLRPVATDGFQMGACSRVVLDHISVSWSIDEALALSNCGQVTVQNTLVAESLNRSVHPEGPHGYGVFARGGGRGGISFYRNLIAHHDQRNPALGAEQEPRHSRSRVDFDFVNNVVYDWGLRAGHTLLGTGLLRLSYLGNVLIAGPSTTCPDCVFNVGDLMQGDRVLIWQRDNWHDTDPERRRPPRPVRERDFGGERTLVDEPFGFERPAVPPEPALEAYERVLREAGASRVRDAVDTRVVAQVRQGSGRIIDTQKQVGGWSAAPPATSPTPDVDRDGMDDRWECRHGLDPADADDRNDRDLGRPYTNLEVYLQDLVARWPGLQESASGAAACGSAGAG